jgi:nudix motif 8
MMQFFAKKFSLPRANSFRSFVPRKLRFFSDSRLLTTHDSAGESVGTQQQAKHRAIPFTREWIPPAPDLPASVRDECCIPEEYDLAKWPCVPYPPHVDKPLRQMLTCFNFTPWMLKRISNRLYELPKPRIDSTFHTGKRAAVMLPLCDVKGIPSVLFTLRSHQVRTHKGQVSFPGGHLDLNDECMEGCAQRECMEEVGLRVVAPTDRRLWESEWRKRPYYPESNVLGRLPNCVSVTGTLVTPIVGYLGPIDMRQVASNVNHDEVQEAFCMSIRDLMTPTNVVHEDLKMASPPPPLA